MADKKALRPHDVFLDEFVPTPEVLDPATARAEREKRIARLRLLWESRRFLWRITAAGLLLSVVIAILLPNKYMSTTQLMPPDQTSSSGLGMGMLAALAGGKGGSGGLGLAGLASDVLGLKETGALFVGILQSRTVQDDLITKFDLRRLYHHRRWEDTRKELARNTEIQEDRKSGIVSLSITDKSPQRAAAMAAEYVDELNRVVTNLNTSSAHKERVFLEERLSQVKEDLESAEKDFSQFASKNAALDIPTQGKAMIEAAAALEGRLIAAQTQLEGLRQIYTDSNVRVRATQATVDELRRQLQKLGGKPGESAPESEDATEMYPSIRRLPILGVAYADLYRHTRVEEAIFETLTQEYELAKVEEAKQTPSVKVLDPGEIPEKHSSPHRALIISLGTVFSFLIGAAWILGEERWNQVDPEDPGKALASEVVETIRSRMRISTSNGSSGEGAGNIFASRLLRRSLNPDSQERDGLDEGGGSDSSSRPDR